MVEETNRKFGDLGVSVSRERVEARAAGPREALVCTACKKPIDGAVLEGPDGVYHPQCFECSKCARTFEYDGRGGFLMIAGKPWCRKCYEWEKKENPKFNAEPSGEGTVRTTPAPPLEPVELPRGALAPASEQRQAYENAQKGKQFCAACGKVISGPAVNFEANVYHDACFSCAACGKPVDYMEGFVPHAGRPYHAECHRKANVAKCPECGQPLVGKIVTAPDGSKHHKDCYVCAGCRGSLAAGLVLREGRPLCVSCAKCSPLAAAATPAPPPAVQAGIRVDPRSGKVRQLPLASAAPAPAAAAPPAPQDAGPTSAGPAATAGANFCTGCGARVSGKFCGQCGRRH
jgi:hypothetical protein